MREQLIQEWPAPIAKSTLKFLHLKLKNIMKNGERLWESEDQHVCYEIVFSRCYRESVCSKSYNYSCHSKTLNSYSGNSSWDLKVDQVSYKNSLPQEELEKLVVTSGSQGREN